MKKLVVYYSFGGNTRSVAKKIAKSIGADIAEIRTVKTYPDDYDVLVSLGKREVESGYIPQIYPLAFDAQNYDTIVLGTPVWWYTFAPAVKTFLQSVKWAGKKVYPFITNGGWAGHTAGDFKKALRGAEVSPVLNVKFEDHQQVTPEKDIEAWVKGI